MKPSMKSSLIKAGISFIIILVMYNYGKQMSSSIALLLTFATAVAVLVYAIYDSKDH